MDTGRQTAGGGAIAPPPAAVRADGPRGEDGADLTPAMQRYLAVVAAAPRRCATTTGVAEELGCSAASASQMLHRLREAELVTAGSSRQGWRLTPRGHRQMATIRRRRAVLERYLRVELGMDVEEASREAARLAPMISVGLEVRLRDAVWPARRPCRGAGAG